METKKPESSLLEPNSNWTDSQKDTYTIYANYFALCLKCTKNSEMSSKFKNPEFTAAFLTDGLFNGDNVWVEEDGQAWGGCGMLLPKNTRVLLDYNAPWPTLYITNKESNYTITIKESPLSVFVTSNDPELNDDFKKSMSESGEVPLSLPISVADKFNYDVTLVMPCFMPDKDMLTKVSCIDSDENEIILTSC